MKQSNLTKFLILTAIAIMGLASCEKPENKTPEDDNTRTEVADVFFSASNGDYCYYVGEGASGEASLSVFRANSTIAAEYAIKVISADKGIEIPESVSFAQGQTETTITVKAPSTASTGDVLSFEIMFTGDNVNSSANSTEGTTRCEGTFYFYQELTAAACFSPYGSSNIADYMGNIRQIVWKLDDSNFIFKNFLGSEYDLKVIINPATGDINALVYGYELYTEVDEYGGTSWVFWIDDENDLEYGGDYEIFSPKGDRRVIYDLELYTCPGYSAYIGGDTPYIYFSLYNVTFYGEEEEIDKSFNWDYLCFYFYSEDKIASMDFESFPEIATVEYPEAVISEEMKDGKYPVQFYLDTEDVDLDTQYAEVTADRKYVISDFMGSGNTVTLIPNGTTFSIEVKNAAGATISTSSGGYLYLGLEYYYPWNSDRSWYMNGMTIYDSAQYIVWDAEKKEAYFYGYYYVKDTSSEGYVYINW